MASHPSATKRLGAGLALNSIYTVFRLVCCNLYMYLLGSPTLHLQILILPITCKYCGVGFCLLVKKLKYSEYAKNVLCSN